MMPEVKPVLGTTTWLYTTYLKITNMEAFLIIRTSEPTINPMNLYSAVRCQVRSVLRLKSFMAVYSRSCPTELWISYAHSSSHGLIRSTPVGSKCSVDVQAMPLRSIRPSLAGGVADEWVTQLLRQGDARVFK